jgi:maltooligosyltrehalose trehalohydrolase
MTAPRGYGPLLDADGVTFRLWAPGARRVELIADSAVEMSCSDGWYFARVPGGRAGTRYRFRIDGELEVPDPASHFQPEDVHGPSEVIDHVYRWQAQNWKGRPWHECVFLEVHTGTFTPQGTFRSMIDKLDHVADTGVTAIELMPVADFFGRWNWGYDGVLFYAPDSAYGRPEDLKALIDAAHRREIMMFLDVVYNHFGPEGNYLNSYAPAFFTPANTPWGAAIDYRNPTVRQFAVENAVHWLREYRFDGLRLDAVHAIAEPERGILLGELSTAVGQLAETTGRHIHLVLENDANQAGLLDPDADPPRGRYRAQWNDDYHHAFHVLLTGETAGYYTDYRDAPRHLSRTLAQGFAYQGEPSRHRNGEPRGEPTDALSPLAFVVFLQNHDQIGNRPFGERLATLASPAAIDAALAVTLLAPMPPLMFMGDEWGAHEPFVFFCDFQGELAQAVREGRKREFAAHYSGLQSEPPDPLSEATFRSACLDWGLGLVRRLLAARREFIVPRLSKIRPGHGQADCIDGLLTAQWKLEGGEMLTILANLSDTPRPRASPVEGKAIWGGPTPDPDPPWSVHAFIGEG